MYAAPTIQDYNDLLFRTQFKALETLARLLEAAQDPSEIRRLLALLVRFKKIKDPDTQDEPQPRHNPDPTPVRQAPTTDPHSRRTPDPINVDASTSPVFTNNVPQSPPPQPDVGSHSAPPSWQAA